MTVAISNVSAIWIDANAKIGLGFNAVNIGQNTSSRLIRLQANSNTVFDVSTTGIVNANAHFANTVTANTVRANNLISSNLSANLTATTVTVTSNTLNLGLSSLGTNGYTRLPNGLLLQWGTTASVAEDGSVTTTYPTPFTAIYSVNISPIGALNNSSFNSGVDSVSAATTTNFTIAHGTAGTRTFYWTAIGI